MESPKVSLDKAIEAYKRYKNRRPKSAVLQPAKRKEKESESL